MNIVHFSKTALAGGPYRLISLLRKHTDFKINLVDYKRWDRYPHDLIYEEDLEEVIEVTNDADIIHFHNYYDQNSRFFELIDFKGLKKKGVKFVCQFRSEPNTVAFIGQTSVNEIMAYDIPTIAIAQYPERFYPNAMVVPNAVPSKSELYMPVEADIEYDILFSPTKKAGAWETRWNTKGSPETLDLLNKLKNKYNLKIKTITGRPLKEVLNEKQKARIVLDDMVTGSYHVSGLEALCQAKPVLCYLDDRICNVLQEVTGTFDNPFVNVRLEDAYEILRHLVQNHELAQEIGLQGRKWIEDYWSEEIVVKHYIDMYHNLFSDPSLVKRQDSLKLDSDIDKYYSLILPDLNYKSRAKNYYASLSIYKKFRVKLKTTVVTSRARAIKYLPKPVLGVIRKFRANFR